jgi:Dolichyl-phosphate-mannose-protein mannosyltransferase
MTELAVTPSSAASECIHDRRLVRRWIAIFIFFGLLWRLVRFALAMPIWGDEAMLGLNLINCSYRDLLQPLKNVQVAPFGFLWALRFTFERFGISDYTARLPSLIAGLGGLLLFWQWARLLVPRQAVMLATAVVAVSGYIVRYGVEMKPYGMDFLATIVLLWLSTSYLRSRRLVWLVALTVAVPLCMAVSYPVIFTAGGAAIGFLPTALRENWRRRIFLALYYLVLGASFIVVLRLSALGQYHEAATGMVQYWHGGFPPANPFKFIVWFAQIHTGNLFAYPLGGKNAASLATVVLFGAGLWMIWLKWRIPIRLILFTPFLLTFIAAVLRLYPYGESPRVSQHLAPVIILVTGVGISALIDTARNSREWRLRVNLAASLLLGIGLISLSRDVIWPYKTKADQQLRTDVRGLIVTAAHDQILVLQPESDVPATLRWYLHERRGEVVYGATPSIDTLKDNRSAWVINCVAGKPDIGGELASKTQMKSEIWLRHDLQIGPKENGPAHLEVVHLVH